MQMSDGSLSTSSKFKVKTKGKLKYFQEKASKEKVF